MIAGEDKDFGRLETSVVVNATTDSKDSGSVEKVDSCTGLESDRPMEVPDGVVPLLELVCIADVVKADKLADNMIVEENKKIDWEE